MRMHEPHDIRFGKMAVAFKDNYSGFPFLRREALQHGPFVPLYIDRKNIDFFRGMNLTQYGVQRSRGNHDFAYRDGNVLDPFQHALAD